MADWQRAHYGENADRLRTVAKRVDPHGVFAFAQGLDQA
ncbi:MAG: BBE domain-containing protein [Sciscionella sp.]